MSVRHIFGLGLLVLLFVGQALLPSQAMAQAGTLYGTAEDVNGAPVQGIQITVTGSALIGGPRSVLTDAQGAFQFVVLPVGDYDVRGEAKGFRTFVEKGVHVALGQNAQITLLMEAESGEQILEVRARAPVVDQRKVGTGQVFSNQFLEEVPLGRSYQSVAEAAPGVSDSDGDGNPTIHGGSSYSNNYYLDGINITDPTTNTFGLNFNYDAINELEVITGLFSPEYGNVTGGVINMVTKSGGNDLTLDSSFFYRGGALRMKDFNGDDLDFESYTGNINVGGPIIEDHLWYYLSLEYGYSSSQLSDESPVPELAGVKHPALRSQRLLWLTKLTWAPNAHNRFDLKFQGDPSTFDNTDQDPSATRAAETHQDQGGLLVGLNYDGLFDDFVVRFSGGFKTQFLDIFPQARADSASPFSFPGFFGVGDLASKNTFGRAGGCLAAGDRADGQTGNGCTRDVQASAEFGNGVHNNIDTGLVSVGSGTDVYIKRDHWYFKPSLSYFLKGLAGNHEFKGGAEISLSKDSETARYPGGLLTLFEGGLPDYDGDNAPDAVGYIVASDDNELTTVNHGRTLAAFVLDNWNLFDRVYLQPGLRVENAQFDLYTGETAIDFTVISPRFGFAVDALGDGRTKVHGGYGRMYETGMLQLSKFVGKSLEARRVRGDANPGDTPLTADEVAALPTDTGKYHYSEDPDRVRIQGGESGTAISSNLEPMKMDEFQLGITQAIGELTAVDLTYVHRRVQNAWEDNESNLLWNQAGTDVIGSRDGTGQQTFVLSTIKDAQRTYNALELSVDRAFADRWLLSASYTLTFYTGTTTELLTRAFDNPRQDVYADGPLADDHRHTVKAQLVYKFDFGLTVGADYTFESGGPYSKYYENAYDGDNTNLRAPRGKDPSDDPNDPSDDKRLRLPDVTILDVRLAYDLFQVTGQHLELIGSAYNVLNLQSVTSVDETVTANNSFGQATGRQSPFQAELGLRYRY